VTADLLDLLAADPGGSGLFLDFDGTLTPIVEDPETSALPAPLVPVLTDLAAALAVVAVVSGRPARFLGTRIEVEGVRRLGLYGLEEWRAGAVVARPEAARWQDEVNRAREVLTGVLGGTEGVAIEDKGLSVAVHWRNAADRDAAERAVTEVVGRLARDTGLAREPGKLVAELRPPVDWDKGAAVRAVSEEAGLSAVAYLGDDLGDLAAFAAVRDLGGLAVAVDHGAETPPQVLDAADLVLDGPGAVARLLTELRDRLVRRPEPGR
jgi:trehalose 6-phosphate phosphatase